jgi:hypothetical protein
VTTGGLANPIVSTLELAGSIVTSILALAAPVLVVFLIALFLFVFGRKFFRKTPKAQPA